MTVKQTVIAAAFLVISTPVYANENIFDRAFSYLNLHERSNRTQIQKVTKVDPVRTPWCAAFVNGILKEIATYVESHVVDAVLKTLGLSQSEDMPGSAIKKVLH